VLTAAAVGLTYTPLFHARSIQVQGLRVVDEGSVLTLAGVELGQDVFHLDTDAVETLLETDPWIAEATVTRDLPGTVLILVTERRPIASGPGGELVSSDGVLLPGGPIEGLPTIGSTDGIVSPSDTSSAVELLRALDPVVLVRVASLTVGGDGNVVMTLEAGTRVEFGEPDDAGEKAAALRAVLRWSAQEGEELVSIDVRVPSAPSAELSGGATVTP
jgi:cell division protein FtsQ